MLRRYLIVNGATTAVLYGALYALTPTLKLENLRASFEGFVMESPVLGPLLNKIILVTSAL
ncbi:hypothetical protein [Hyphomicrobium sp.]|uniref:hypothetical protein n=1 Tax=Hyphomicrobium sp. TaxID=82 RepID=UPI002D772155|nr:hypothetical protein [Hyphomicrobium sp.]HET6389151.1 hypothetical protein [Hyphomicrobium sp.]